MKIAEKYQPTNRPKMAIVNSIELQLDFTREN